MRLIGSLVPLASWSDWFLPPNRVQVLATFARGRERRRAFVLQQLVGPVDAKTVFGHDALHFDLLADLT